MVIGAALLLVIVAAWALTRGEKKTTAGPYVPPPSSSSTPGPEDQPTALVPPEAAPTGFDGLPTQGVPGLEGDGFVSDGGRHSVVVSVTSDAEVVFAGYRVPTANKSDSAKGVRSLKGTATAFGHPDYAQVFVTAGPYSTRTVCTVTVDGKVTDRRVGEGPYAYLFCQG